MSTIQGQKRSARDRRPVCLRASETLAETEVQDKLLSDLDVLQSSSSDSYEILAVHVSVQVMPGPGA